MKLLTSLLVTLGSLVGCTPAYADSYKYNPKVPLIKVVGEVGSNILETARVLDKLSAKGTKEVVILINSPGGAVIPGIQFTDSIKQAKVRGTKITCIVPVLAASMAFHFLAECDERIALEHSLLLWHPMKVGGMMVSLSAAEMEYLALSIHMLEDEMNARLIQVLAIDPQVFAYHYFQETLWTALALRDVSPKFVRIVDSIEGIKDLFNTEIDSETMDRLFKRTRAVEIIN